jgi:hypothetical protein
LCLGPSEGGFRASNGILSGCQCCFLRCRICFRTANIRLLRGQLRLGLHGLQLCQNLALLYPVSFLYQEFGNPALCIGPNVDVVQWTNLAGRGHQRDNILTCDSGSLDFFALTLAILDRAEDSASYQQSQPTADNDLPLTTQFVCSC